MDLEEEIAMLKKENKKLKERLDIMKATASTHIQDINEVHQDYGDIIRKLKETNEIRFDKIKEMEHEIGVSKLIHHQNMGLLEDLKKLKKENEELKDGENTAKMIDKLNDEFSVLQDKNMKLEKQNEENIEAKVKLYKEFLKIQEEMDLLYDYTDYDENMINPDYSKADGIEEWMCAREDEISDFQSETRDLEEKNKELKKEKECSEKELKTIEGLLRIFANDNKLPDESLDCQGCRIRQIGAFIAFMIDNIRKESETVVQATPIK